MVRDARKRIRLLEREIAKIKVLHALGKMSTAEAKASILHLDSHITKNLDMLPEHERQLYSIKREFGHMG